MYQEKIRPFISACPVGTKIHILLPPRRLAGSLCCIYFWKFVLKKKTRLIFIFLVISVNSWSQVKITGTVVSKDDNLPIPGVNVVEKGTKNGTLTDPSGHFTITVANSNVILVCSFIGMITKEFPLKGETDVLIKTKWDCNKDFFDSQELQIYLFGGVINTPLGGKVKIASPWVFPGGVIKASYSYQSNLDQNTFHNSTLELNHFISNCDFDMDFRLHYRNISFNNELYSTINSIETDFNIGRIKIIAGYSHLDMEKVDFSQTNISSGVLIGIGTNFNVPLHPTAIVKASFFKDQIEYQVSIQGGYRRLLSFINFYKLASYNELSIGVGYSIAY